MVRSEITPVVGTEQCVLLFLKQICIGVKAASMFDCGDLSFETAGMHTHLDIYHT